MKSGSQAGRAGPYNKTVVLLDIDGVSPLTRDKKACISSLITIQNLSINSVFSFYVDLIRL
jgi:hypothetical protein